MNSERFTYSVDHVTTDEYISAISDLEKAAYGRLSEPYSIVDLDISVIERIPSLRKIILAAGAFFTDCDGKNGWYDLRKSDNSKEILLEAIDHNPFRKDDDSPMIRLSTDFNVREKKQKRKRTIDIWIPDTTNTQYISRINAIENIGEKKEIYNPFSDIKDINTHNRARKFFDLWREGLRNLINIIPPPVYDSFPLLEDYA